MLIFKKNIYEKNPVSPHTVGNAELFIPEYQLHFDPVSFITGALQEEANLFEILAKQPAEYQSEDMARFFPNACKIGKLEIIRAIIQRLWKGMTDANTWYHMNSYHLLVLYDILFRYAYNYNRDSREERCKTLPELKGAPLRFDLFIKDYFADAVFLMNADKFNAMSPERKKGMGCNCPCLFSAINGLVPTREEMELMISKDYPYSIYV